MSEPDALSIGAACVIRLPASPVALDHDVGHRVNFTVVVDPAALASPDGAAGAQDALSEDSRRNDTAGNEVASEGATEALESLVGEFELSGVEIVATALSPIATALGTMAWRRPTVLELQSSDCRYPVSSKSVLDAYGRRRTEHRFCAQSASIGSYCDRHHRETHTPIMSRQFREQQRAPQKLSRLAIVAALKRE